MRRRDNTELMNPFLSTLRAAEGFMSEGDGHDGESGGSIGIRPSRGV